MKSFKFSIPVSIEPLDGDRYWSREKSIDIIVSAESLDDAVKRVINNFEKALKLFN